MNLQLTSTKAQVENALTTLSQRGFQWSSNSKYYTQRSNSNEFFYYLNDVQLPAPTETVAPSPPSATPGKPQPRAWDAVLGGEQSEQN